MIVLSPDRQFIHFGVVAEPWSMQGGYPTPSNMIEQFAAELAQRERRGLLAAAIRRRDNSRSHSYEYPYGVRWSLTLSQREYDDDPRAQAFIAGSGTEGSYSADQMAEVLMRGEEEHVLVQRYEMLTTALSERGVQATLTKDALAHECPMASEFVENGRALEKAIVGLLLSETKKLLSSHGLPRKLAKKLTRSNPPERVDAWMDEMLEQRTARHAELAAHMSARGVEHPIDLSFTRMSLYDESDSDNGYGENIYGYGENYTCYAEEADKARYKFVELGVGKVDKVVNAMWKVIRLRQLLHAVEQLPDDENKPMHAEDWAQSENEECIRFIERGRMPRDIPDVDALAAHLAERGFHCDYYHDYDDGDCRYDDPMQEYYDEGYGSG